MKTVTKYMLKGFLLASLMLPATDAAAESFSFTVSPGFADVRPDTVTGYDGCRYTRLRCDGCAYLSETGTPDIPYRIYEIEVPTYSNNFAIRTVSCSAGDKVLLDAPVWPHQPPVSLNDNPADFFTPLTSDALADAMQPQPVVFDDGFEQGRIHTVRIGVPIYSYGDSVMSLTPYSVLNLQLDYQPCTAEEMCHRPIGLRKEVTACSLLDKNDKHGTPVWGNDIVDNGGITTTEVSQYAGRYFIITPEQFKKDLDMLIALKRAKGLDVRVKSIEDIVASTDGRDDAERLRNWLMCNVDTLTWQNHVLLVGGKYTNTPVRKFRKFTDKDMDRFADLPFDHLLYIPSDAYFSDLNSQYSLLKGKNGNYSCFVRIAPFSGVLPVGRIPANSAQELHNYLNKLYYYELYPGNGNPDYLNNGLVVRQNQFVNNTHPSFFKDYSYNGNIRWLDDPGGDSFENNHPTGEEVIDAVSDSGLISIIGHATPIMICVSGNSGDTYRYITAMQGYEHSVCSPDNTYQLEYNNSFDRPNKITSPNILFTVGCSTASIDSYEDHELPYNMGSSFTCAKGSSGVAFIGNTRPLYIENGPQLEAGFGKYLNEDISIGEAHLKSLGVINQRYCQFMRMLFGDPEFKVWNGTPSVFNINTDKTLDNIVLKSGDLASSRLTLNDGKCVLKTHLIDSNQNSYTISKTDLNTNLNFGEYGICSQFTLTKRGFIPYSRLVVENAIINSPRYFILNCPVTITFEDGNSLDIKQGGGFHIQCLGSFTTNKAVTVEYGGQMSIKTDNQVHLKGDIVKNGGKLEIISNSTTLGSGFVIEKGGSLTIKPKAYE